MDFRQPPERRLPLVRRTSDDFVAVKLFGIVQELAPQEISP